MRPTVRVQFASSQGSVIPAKAGIHSSRGFTLVEVLVAIVIFMIIIGSIYGALRTANMSVSRTEERADVYQTARVLLEQINSELCSAYQPQESDASTLIGEDTDASETAPQYDALTFLTTGRRPPASTEPAGDLCEVAYLVHKTPDEEPIGLFVQESFRPGIELGDQEPQPVMLSELVVGLNCEYLDAPGGDWLKEWTNRNALPVAVRVELVLKPEREGAKPIMVSSTANIEISAEGRSSPAEEADVEE